MSSVALYDAEDHKVKRNECKAYYQYRPDNVLERTCVKIRLVVHLFFQNLSFPVSSCKSYQRNWDQKQDECAADAARVGDQHLWVLVETHEDDYWNRKDYRPNAFNKTAIILH